MSSNKKYQKNYTEFNETYQLVLSLDLEGFVPEDDSVRLLSHELEELDYTLLYQAYSAKGRKSAVDPKTMFKILTYAYSQNIYSSRKIETACRRDINFMWLLAGGLIYTVGGIIYALKLPIFNSKHKNFGSHEIFHLFVMGGSACHYVVMYMLTF